MKISYSRQALKDVNKIKDQKLKDKLYNLVFEIKSAKQLSDIKNIKKISGYPDVYRIRIGDYRLGIVYKDDVLILARFLKRNDIYKVFP